MLTLFMSEVEESSMGVRLIVAPEKTWRKQNKSIKKKKKSGPMVAQLTSQHHLKML